ncbi:MAG TPA: glycogen synthase, partial [Abditibacteriaceae bacterium]
GYFCRAAIEMLRLPNLLKWQPDIVHCHDWHCGLLPAYLKTVYADDAALQSLKTVFTIHNLAYQGLAPKENLPLLGFDWSLFNSRQLEYYDQINPMKAGLVFADEITTVSVQYAREVQTPEYGEGLEGVLHERKAALHGIVNGIDYSQWSPLHDTYLCTNYSATKPANKAKCKRELLRRIGLATTSRKRIPVVGMVSRLSSQKGFDLVAEALESMLEMGCLFVLLGTGDEKYVRLFENLGQQFPQSTSINLGSYNEELAHHIYAGSDFFLMPSLYEPCGLGQMIALAYGTVPIVRATGGLADSVHEWNPQTGSGNGFVFEKFSADAMLDAVRRAISAYHSKEWPALVQNTFACDFSWDVSAERYQDLYASLIE